MQWAGSSPTKLVTAFAVGSPWKWWHTKRILKTKYFKRIAVCALTRVAPKNQYFGFTGCMSAGTASSTFTFQASSSGETFDPKENTMTFY